MSKTDLHLVSLKERYRLNHSSSEKKTYHLTLDLKGLDLTYGVGDCVGIYPTNSPLLVEQILTSLGATGTETIVDRGNTPHSLSSFLLHKANLQRVNPALVAHLGLPPSVAAIECVATVLKYPHSLTPQACIEFLSPLLPRLYSISSSMKEVGEEMHLTVGLTEYAMDGKPRQGICSYYLTHLAPLHSPVIPIYLQKERGFTLPPSAHDRPIIMIGPGTGVAPFRGFMQERVSSAHIGPSWLFFGERHQALDYYYQPYWESLERQGKLRLDLAFSRDQKEKVYVQHKMKENAKDFFQWLEKGALLFVCGDALRMAKDVEKTLLEIISQEGGLTEPQARAYLKNLRQEKRYLRDIY